MIFISHKNDPDHALALRFASEMQKRGVQSWLAPESIKGGEDFAVEIPGAINTSELFVLLLTEKTALSPHVRKELMLAISHKKPIIPLKIGDFEIDESYEYLLADVQIVPFDFSPAAFASVAEACRRGERLVEMEIGKNPKRTLSIIRGDFQENMDYMLRHRPEELAHTVFAMGMDASSRLDISSTKGILKYVIAYLSETFGVTIDDLQELIDKAKTEQLGHTAKGMPLQFKDALTVSIPVKTPEGGEVPLQLLFIANSRKKESFRVTGDVDEVEGIDSREIIIEVFNRCKALGDRAKTLFIGAMGTNGLAFPYEVVTSEILNCFVYAQKMKITPTHLYYSIRQEDMQKAGITVDEMLAYIGMVVHFFRD